MLGVYPKGTSRYRLAWLLAESSVGRGKLLLRRMAERMLVVPLEVGLGYQRKKGVARQLEEVVSQNEHLIE